MGFPQRRILVPIHNSAASRAALQHATRLASELEAELSVISVLPVHALEASEYAWGPSVTEAEEAMIAQLDQPAIHWHRGDPLATIVRLAADPHVAMVVMGNGCHGPLRRGFQAPLHERVIREVQVPVLVVRADDDKADSAGLTASIPRLARDRPPVAAQRPHLHVVRSPSA